MQEKFLTAGIGIFIGVLIAAGIFFGPRLLEKVNPSSSGPVSPVSESESSPTPVTLSPSQIVAITSLTPGQIVTTKTVDVVGITIPGATVIVTSSSDEQTVKADDLGNFTVKLKIDEGENTVVASVTDERGTLQLDKKQIILEVSE